MFAHRNTSTDVLGAVVVVGMVGWAALASVACGGASPLQQPAVEPNTVPGQSPGEAPTPKERVGTGSALGESIPPPPASATQDAGPHQDRKNSPDAGPPPAAVPTPQNQKKK